jgi:hypothetical protein
VKFYTEIELDAAGPIPEARFDALADALYDLDANDPAIESADLGASLADGRATVTITVDADDPAEAGTKALCTVRAAIHAIGDATPGWETARGVMRVAPADVSDRLYVSA